MALAALGYVLALLELELREEMEEAEPRRMRRLSSFFRFVFLDVAQVDVADNEEGVDEDEDEGEEGWGFYLEVVPTITLYRRVFTPCLSGWICG